MPRISAIAGGNPFQPFSLPGAAPDQGAALSEKIRETEMDQSGSLGIIGLTEKEIDERVCLVPVLPLEIFQG
jgi:hypothetical protein